MVYKSIIGTACVCLSVVSFSANAALLSRLGGLAVYDTDLDVTWLADTRASEGSGFDDGVRGTMSWVNANTWAQSLLVGGYSDWRLPTTSEVDSSCTADSAGNTQAASSEGYNCSGSEMGHLFYNELSGVAGSSIRTNASPALSLFSMDQPALVFWSGTEWGHNPEPNAWWFRFGDGQQGASAKSATYSAIAVRNGDVSSVPAPAAVWLFGSGLVGLIGFARSKKA